MSMTPEGNGDLCKKAMQCFRDVDGSLSSFPGLIKKIIREKAWERREHNGRIYELPSLKDLVTRKPLEGWGEDVNAIEALLKSDPEALQMWNNEMKRSHGGDRKSEQAKIKPDNISLGQDYGTSKAHSLDVLKRKAPEKFQAVCNGELSANAAMIAAGLRKPTVTVTSDPAAAVKTLRKKFGDDYIKEMIKIIQSES